MAHLIFTVFTQMVTYYDIHTVVFFVILCPPPSEGYSFCRFAGGGNTVALHSFSERPFILWTYHDDI